MKAIIVTRNAFMQQPNSYLLTPTFHQYAEQYAGAAAIIERLEGELERERELTSRLREHYHRARELVEGLTNTTDRNVRNLQDAIGIISEIREKLKVLADFYVGWNSGDGFD